MHSVLDHPWLAALVLVDRWSADCRATPVPHPGAGETCEGQPGIFAVSLVHYFAAVRSERSTTGGRPPGHGRTRSREWTV